MSYFLCAVSLHSIFYVLHAYSVPVLYAYIQGILFAILLSNVIVLALAILVFPKNLFLKKIKSRTHQALVWELVWKDQKGCLISTKFRGASGHFCFDHFYIEDFHSAFSQPGHEGAE